MKYLLVAIIALLGCEYKTTIIGDEDPHSDAAPDADTDTDTDADTDIDTDSDTCRDIAQHGVNARMIDS